MKLNGKWVVVGRQLRRLTRKELASKLQISIAQLRDIERGVADCPRHLHLRLCIALSFPLNKGRSFFTKKHDPIDIKSFSIHNAYEDYIGNFEGDKKGGLN